MPTPLTYQADRPIVLAGASVSAGYFRLFGTTPYLGRYFLPEDDVRGVTPLEAWPEVSTKFVLCSEDRFFPPDFFRRLVPERLGIIRDEIPGSHCVALSRPGELADLLVAYISG